jgi:hypothetical protein
VTVLFFNARRVGGIPKHLSLNQLIQSHNLEVILLQETNCEGYKVRAILEKWLKNWSFCTIDVEGQSSGILSGWSPSCKAISPTSFNSAIEQCTPSMTISKIGYQIILLSNSKVFHAYL